MFFFTKLAGALLKPLSLIIAAILLGLVLAAFTRWRRSGFALITLATLALGLLSWWPFANSLMAPLESHYPPFAMQLPAETGSQNGGGVSAVIVLGGGGIDEPTIPITSQLSSTGLQRLIEGIRLWREHPEALLVTSGALSRGRSQAEIAADLAEELGVPRAKIRMLTEARNTSEEAAAYAQLMRSESVAETTSAAATATARSPRPILVTSASHLPRAMAAFQSAGIDPLPAPTAYRALPRHFDLPTDFAPSADDLRTTEAAWHEYLGRLWAWLRGG